LGTAIIIGEDDEEPATPEVRTLIMQVEVPDAQEAADLLGSDHFMVSVSFPEDVTFQTITVVETTTTQNPDETTLVETTQPTTTTAQGHEYEEGGDGTCKLVDSDESPLYELVAGAGFTGCMDACDLREDCYGYAASLEVRDCILYIEEPLEAGGVKGFDSVQCFVRIMPFTCDEGWTPMEENYCCIDANARFENNGDQFPAECCEYGAVEWRSRECPAATPCEESSVCQSGLGESYYCSLDPVDNVCTLCPYGGQQDCPNTGLTNSGIAECERICPEKVYGTRCENSNECSNTEYCNMHNVAVCATCPPNVDSCITVVDPSISVELLECSSACAPRSECIASWECMDGIDDDGGDDVTRKFCDMGSPTATCRDCPQDGAESCPEQGLSTTAMRECLEACSPDLTAIEIVESMYVGASDIQNPGFLFARDAEIYVKVDVDTFPDHAEWDGKTYDHETVVTAFIDIIETDVLHVTNEVARRRTGITFIDEAYKMADYIRIAAKCHLGHVGVYPVRYDVIYVWSIFEHTETMDHIAPEYYTGYQIMKSFNCLGSYEYCHLEMTRYFGDEWDEGHTEEETCDGVTMPNGSCCPSSFTRYAFGQPEECCKTEIQPGATSCPLEGDPCSCPEGWGWSSSADRCLQGRTTNCWECPTLNHCESGNCFSFEGNFNECPDFDYKRTCQCDVECNLYGNCCPDADQCNREGPCDCRDGQGWSGRTNKCEEGSTTTCAECSTRTGCQSSKCKQAFCPHQYDPDRICQCTSQCVLYGNCCDDFALCTEISNELYIMTGMCGNINNCLNSGNYPSRYNNGEVCGITMQQDVLVRISWLFGIADEDELIIGDTKILSKTDVPDMLESGTYITWSTDDEGTQTGWELCFVPVPTTTMVATTTGACASSASCGDNSFCDMVDKETTSCKSCPQSGRSGCSSLDLSQPGNVECLEFCGEGQDVGTPTVKPTTASPTLPQPTSIPTTPYPSKSPTVPPTSPPSEMPTPSPTMSPIYKPNEHASNVPGFDCTIRCDSNQVDYLGLTAAQACSKCHSGGYLNIINEADQMSLLHDFDLYGNYMWSFYSTLILDVEGSANFLQFTIGGDTIQFLQVLQYKIYLNYPLNGTVTQFSVPELTLETSQEYTIALSTETFASMRRNLADSASDVVLTHMNIHLLVQGGSSGTTQTSWSVIAAGPSPEIESYDISDDIQNERTLFAYHSASMNEMSSMHAFNTNEIAGPKQKEYGYQAIILGSVFMFLVTCASLLANVFFGYDVPSIAAYLGPWLCVLDFGSDTHLVYALWDEDDSLKFYPMIALALTLVFNLFVLSNWHCNSVSKDAFLGKWMRRHLWWTRFIMIFGALDVSMIQGCWTQMFPSSLFNMPIGHNPKAELLKSGLIVTTFIHNIPLIIFQMLILTGDKSDYLQDAALIAIVISVLTVVYSFMTWFAGTVKVYVGVKTWMRCTVADPPKGFIYRRAMIAKAIQKVHADVEFDVVLFAEKGGDAVVEVTCLSDDLNQDDIEDTMRRALSKMLGPNSSMSFNKEHFDIVDRVGESQNLVKHRITLPEKRAPENAEEEEDVTTSMAGENSRHPGLLGIGAQREHSISEGGGVMIEMGSPRGMHRTAAATVPEVMPGNDVVYDWAEDDDTAEWESAVDDDTDGVTEGWVHTDLGLTFNSIDADDERAKAEVKKMTSNIFRHISTQNTFVLSKDDLLEYHEKATINGWNDLTPYIEVALSHC